MHESTGTKGPFHESRVAFQRTYLFTTPSPRAAADVFTIGNLVGQGTFGRVYLAGAGQHRRGPDDGSFVAKCFAKGAASHAGKHGASDPRLWLLRQESFRLERAMLAALEHPHIVMMRESFESYTDLYLTMECCDTDLYALVTHEVGLPVPTVQHFFWQMAYAVSYLHSLRIVHRDLKVDNWLLVDRTSLRLIKLCDFGSAARLREAETVVPGSVKTRGHAGTMAYHPPEVFAGLGQTLAADDWALGVLLYIMLVGEHPFKQPLTQDTIVIERICAGAYDKKKSKWMAAPTPSKDLINSLLCVEQMERYKSVQLLSHSWVLEASPDDDILAALVQVIELMECYRSLDELQRLIFVVSARFLPAIAFAEEGYSQNYVPWYQLFVMLDKDRDGRISLQEFQENTTASLWGPSRGSLIRALDIDDSGYIEWCEWAALAVFAAARHSEMMTLSAEPVASLLRVLDAPSGDGVVTVDDLMPITVPTIKDQGTCTGYPASCVHDDEVGVHLAENCLAMLVRKWGTSSSKLSSIIGLQIPHLQRMMSPATLQRANKR